MTHSQTHSNNQYDTKTTYIPPASTETLPNFVSRQPAVRTQEEHEPTAAEVLMSYIWPVGFWTIHALNIWGALTAVFGMWSNGYHPANAFFMSFTLVISFAAMSIIDRYVLRGK